MYVSTPCFKSIIYNINVLNSVLSSVFYIEGLNRTSIHAQNNQSMLHALWPRRHCATAPSKDTFHGIFAILLFLPQASIHIQSFELHGMKAIPPKKNKRTSICISSTIMFNGFFDSFLANFPPCTPSNFPQLHLGPQRLLLHLLRVFASVETRCEFIKMWDTRHGSHTYPYTIHVTGISTYIYRKKRCQNVGKYTSPMDGIWASTKNIDFCRHVKSENTQGQCFFNLETVFQRTKWETHRKTFTLVNLTQEETDTRCVTCEGRCSSLAQEFDFQMILWWKKFCTS